MADHDRSRRQVLKTVAAGVAIPGTAMIGTAAGRSDSRSTDDTSNRSRSGEVSATEIGLDGTITTLLENGRSEQARRLLDRHDVRHDVTQRPVQDDEVGIHGRYSESQSTIGSLLYQLEDDLYRAAGWMRLRGYRARLRDAFLVEDACGIVFDSSEWTSPEPTAAGVYLNDPDPHTLSYDHYNPNHGVAATLSLQPARWPERTVYMHTDLIKRNDDDRVPIKFAYEHTWAAVNSYLSGVSISLAGGTMSVSLPRLASTAWADETSAHI